MSLLLKLVTLALSLLALLYASPFGVACGIGLMTWDLPQFCAPIWGIQPFIWLSALFVVPLASAGWWLQNPRRSVLLLGVAATLWVWCVPLFRFNWLLRRAGLQRSAALMTAQMVVPLEKYRLRNGEYPEELRQLGVPIRTGMVSYSQLRYRRANQSAPFPGYEIRVHTGWAFNFDSFFYWPSGKYPARIYGGSTEIIRSGGRNWAYVHE